MMGKEMDDRDKKVKGNVMIGYRNFVKRKWGQDGLHQMFKDKRVDLSDLQDKKWYHYRLSTDLLDWIEQTYGIDYCRQAGYSVIVDAGVITWAARIMGIKRVLEKGVQEFRNNLNYGVIEIDQKENSAEISLKDVITGETDKMAWKGVFEGIMKITKKEGTVDVSGKGSKVTYHLKWK